MKYRARFSDGAGGERTREVEIVNDSRHVEALLDGQTARFDCLSLSAGSFSIVGPAGRHVEATVHVGEDGLFRVHVGSETFSFELLDELTARALSATGRGAARKQGDVKAAIPGRVLRVLTAAGETVALGQTLLVLEAMKMENDVKAPRDGRVRSVDVIPGQAVGTGDVLIRFEIE